MKNSLTVSLEVHDKIRSVTMDDAAMWREVLNEVVALLQNPNGYAISRKQLVNWAETADIPLQGDE